MLSRVLGKLAAFTAIALVTAGTAAAFAPAGAPSTRSSVPTTEIEASADWILQGQLPNGAIASYVDRQFVSPYGASFAALGLARAAAVTGDSRYLDATWRWLRWYQSQQRPSGYVTDYTVSDGSTVTSTGSMDSTDAYAGMFLVAAQAAWQASHDRHRLATLAPGIAGAVRAIESTQEADGLTWAKPDYRVKYAMDQAETYAGLRAAVQLAGVLGNSKLRGAALTDANRLRAGFARLWNPSTGSYDWALHDDGSRQPTNWQNLYPDALEQLWPVAFGLVTGTRAATVARNFAAAEPAGWATGADNYWAVGAWAFQRVGRTAAAQSAATAISAEAARVDYAWPYTTGDAGQLIVAQTGGFTS